MTKDGRTSYAPWRAGRPAAVLALAWLAGGCAAGLPLSGTPPRAPVRVGLVPFRDLRPRPGSPLAERGPLAHAPADAPEAVADGVAAALGATAGVSVVRVELPAGEPAPGAYRDLARERDLDLLLRGAVLAASAAGETRPDFSTEYRARVRFRVDWVAGRTGEVVVAGDPVEGGAEDQDEPPTLSAEDGGRPSSFVTRPVSAGEHEVRLFRVYHRARDRALARFRRSHRMWQALGVLEAAGSWPRPRD